MLSSHMTLTMLWMQYVCITYRLHRIFKQEMYRRARWDIYTHAHTETVLGVMHYCNFIAFFLLKRPLLYLINRSSKVNLAFYIFSIFINIIHICNILYIYIFIYTQSAQNMINDSSNLCVWHSHGQKFWLWQMLCFAKFAA